MAITGILQHSLERRPSRGIVALMLATVAIAVPTFVRFAVDSHVSGIAFSPYIPFVFLTALTLTWCHATVVVLISTIVADLLFVDPRFVPLAGPTDGFGITVFLASSILIIALAQAARRMAHTRPRPAASQQGQTGIIFSMEKGQAWASWQGSGQPLRLGPESEVAEMMQDFLAQRELGKRLAAKYPSATE